VDWRLLKETSGETNGAAEAVTARSIELRILVKCMMVVVLSLVVCRQCSTEMRRWILKRMNARLRKSLDIYTSVRPAIARQKVSLNKL
jgi:predicted HicB family RNase H-like nuclease